MDDQLIKDKVATKEAELQQVVANFNSGEQQRVQIVNALANLRTQATHLEGQVTALRELLGDDTPEAPTLPPEEAPAEDAPAEETSVKEPPIEEGSRDDAQ